MQNSFTIHFQKHPDPRVALAHLVACKTPKIILAGDGSHFAPEIQAALQSGSYIESRMRNRLPKQWRHWCQKAGLQPYYRRGRGQAQHTWFYLEGRGHVWRVNCFAQFQRGDTLQEFDRWALCDIAEAPIPQSEAEFLATVQALLNKG